MTCFICPVCRNALVRKEKTYICEKGHSFDVAKSGYVNLLLSSAHAKQHGDDKEMVKARERFLNSGAYDALSKRISELVSSFCKDGSLVVDAGCGECKYTCDVISKLREDGKACHVAGIDISKEALSLARHRKEKPELAVTSVAALPIADNSVDVIISIFAPFVAEEFERVLSEEGVVIRVYPLERHLWQLKELLYETPYENPVSEMKEERFWIASSEKVRYEVLLENKEQIESLFKMTPYFYRTRREDKEKLLELDSLTTELEFGITVYKKGCGK